MERSPASADRQQSLSGVHRIARLHRDADDFAAPAGDNVSDHLHRFQRHHFIALIDDLADADMNGLHHPAQGREFIARPGSANRGRCGRGGRRRGAARDGPVADPAGPARRD